MRLINTKTLELHEFFNENTPPYAILSHAWGDQEVTFRDWQNHQQVTQKHGYSKILQACNQALNQKLEWLWVDTNCIDKSSSAELSEAINSMFVYYQRSEVCYAYLADVPTANQDRELLNSELRSSRWFTRGWTLQELIAPRHLVFYAADWSSIGSKDDTLVDLLTSITKIESTYLTGYKGIYQAPISKRMSWLAKRKTTRIEDMAYCMLGIFDINMPLLYGEGKRAFFRLQEEIIKICNDHTIFCWGWNEDVPDDWASLLSPWPTTFAGAGGFKIESSENVSVFSMTNAGLSIRLPVIGTITDKLISSHSWFVMLQAAPASILADLQVITWKLSTADVDVAVEPMMAAGRNPGFGSYIFLGVKRKLRSLDVSAQLVAGQNGDTVLRSQAIGEALCNFHKQVDTENLCLKTLASGGRQGVRMILQKSTDVISGTRNCFFLIFSES
ncbi:beta transducin [Fusarium sp. NRRL 25303]|nr:beta transducin [Fusarium sp. NRRL 25303]